MFDADRLKRFLVSKLVIGGGSLDELEELLTKLDCTFEGMLTVYLSIAHNEWMVFFGLISIVCSANKRNPELLYFSAPFYDTLLFSVNVNNFNTCFGFFGDIMRGIDKIIHDSYYTDWAREAFVKLGRQNFRMSVVNWEEKRIIFAPDNDESIYCRWLEKGLLKLV